MVAKGLDVPPPRNVGVGIAALVSQRLALPAHQRHGDYQQEPTRNAIQLHHDRIIHALQYDPVLVSDHRSNANNLECRHLQKASASEPQAPTLPSKTLHPLVSSVHRWFAHLGYQCWTSGPRQRFRQKPQLLTKHSHWNLSYQRYEHERAS